MSFNLNYQINPSISLLFFQMFYPISKNATVIRQGDILAARCTMRNYLEHVVYVGPTGNDEMCNFYLMFYVDGDNLPIKRSCFTAGPSNYYWAIDRSVGPVPKDVDKSASIV